MIIKNYKEIFEDSFRQIRLSFPLGNTKLCLFSIKKFETRCKQIILPEIVNVNHRESHHLCKNRYYIANKCENIERLNDV